MTTSTAGAFRAAAEATDIEGMLASMSDDVVLHSPVSHRPFTSRAQIQFVLEVLAESFVDFRYTDQLDGDQVTALVFRATVDGRELEGLDLLRFDPSGLVSELTVMMRPMSGLDAVLRRVGRAIENAAS
jgi:hypothetical protein